MLHGEQVFHGVQVLRGALEHLCGDGEERRQYELEHLHDEQSYELEYLCDGPLGETVLQYDEQELMQHNGSVRDDVLGHGAQVQHAVVRLNDVVVLLVLVDEQNVIPHDVLVFLRDGLELQHDELEVLQHVLELLYDELECQYDVHQHDVSVLQMDDEVIHGILVIQCGV